jgi:NAD(P)-dependent dehydrogenase (short-subunit alcohol dehydrogenase family)
MVSCELAETLFWRRGDTVVLAVIRNARREAAVDSAGKIEDVFGEPIDVEIKLAKPATAIRNLRTGEKLPDGMTIKARWQPWEALLFEMNSPP